MVYRKNKCSESKNVYKSVTEYVIKELEKGFVPWKTGWNCYGAPRNIASGYVYHGWNTFFLNYITALEQYKTPFFLTCNQAEDMGGYVRKNEKGYPVIFWKSLVTEYKALKGGINEIEEKEYPRSRLIIKVYSVFNIDQTSGIDFVIPMAHEKTAHEKIETCERLIKQMPKCPPIRHGGDYARYFAGMDYIQAPNFEQFQKPEYFYQTLFRELVHSTGHPFRLSRKELQFFITGDDRCVKEELVGELGMAYLCAYTGIEQEILENNSSYINRWLNRLQEDKALLIKAATQAEAATNHILHANWNQQAAANRIETVAI